MAPEELFDFLEACCGAPQRLRAGESAEDFSIVAWQSGGLL
jgi:hypothetical protein